MQEIQTELETKINNLIPSSSSQVVVDDIEYIISRIVLAFYNNDCPFDMTADLHQIIEQREIDLRIYEMNQCIYYFIHSDYTTDEFSLYYILSMQFYISINR